jgi:very-short-patch-repair endonuclease
LAKNVKKSSEEIKQKTSKIWSTDMKESIQDNLYPSKHNQVKPNKRESQIGQILTDAEIRFKFHRSVDYQTLQNEHRKKEVDIFIRPKKIIEHNGTYNHADPRKYKSDDLIREHGKMIKASEIWKREKIILKQIKKQGYKILVIWEEDLLKDIENTTKKILKFAKL